MTWVESMLSQKQKKKDFHLDIGKLSQCIWYYMILLQ